MYKSKKSQIFDCIDSSNQQQNMIISSTQFGTLVVDLSVEIPKYVAKQVWSQINCQIDIVSDFYHELSVRSPTRTSRGSSSRLLFDIDDIVPDNVLKNDQFKTDFKATGGSRGQK